MRPNYKPEAQDTPKHLGGHFHFTHVDRGALSYLRELGYKSLIDIGCGAGGQVAEARKMGFSAVGVDGDANVKPDILHDFTKGPIILPPAAAFDVAWSVEFVEHVEERYIKNVSPIFDRVKVVVMTHALPGQPGHHHVNCRVHAYWFGFMAALGFICDTDMTAALLNRSTMERPFLRRSGKVFTRA
jgi:hypothetical protein